MKTFLFLLVVVILFGNTLFAQKNKEIGWRFSYFETDDALRKSLIHPEDSSDLLLKIYDAVLYNRLNLSIDSSYLGNDIDLREVPLIKHLYSPKTGEILYSKERIDYLTNREESDDPLSDEYGNPLTRMNSDGVEEYVYPLSVLSPLNSTHEFEFRILEKGIFNSKKDKWEYELVRLGIQGQNSWEVVWSELKDIKKVIKNCKEYPFFVKLKSERLNKTSYKQIGANHTVNQEDFKIRRTIIKNEPENALLFRYSNTGNESEDFLSHVLKQCSRKADGSMIYAKFCLQNMFWNYSFLENNFKKYVELTYPKEGVDFPILIHSDKDSMFNEAFHSLRTRYSEGANHTFYDVHLYIHPSDIKEIRIKEMKTTLSDGTISDFKISTIAFVIDFHGVNREIFSVKMKDLTRNNTDKSWYDFLINSKYKGSQYYQSVEARSFRF